jgi:hypothetical protein
VALAGTIAAGLAAYFVLSLYVLPQSYQSTLQPKSPEPIITNTTISAKEVKLGGTFTVFVEGTNVGDDDAEMQTVSIAFPNLTTTDNVRILSHDFTREPLLVNAGRDIGSEYVGFERPVKAAYASVEASNLPWERGSAYSIKLEVKPNAEGRFVVFVKSIALPHTWEGAHYPHEGIMDYQKEFVQPYWVQVTKT